MVFGGGIGLGIDSLFNGEPIEDAVHATLAHIKTDLDSKRTLKSAEIILRDYWKHWGPVHDQIELLGTEIPIARNMGDWEFWGKMDKVIKTWLGVSVMDHKTTSLYVQQYIKGVPLDNQFTGYIKLLSEAYEGADSAMIDVIHVPKPLKDGSIKTQFDRVPTQRSPFKLNQWEAWAQRTVKRIRESREHETWGINPAYCHAWNRECQFYDICQMDMAVDEIVRFLEDQPDFEKVMWEPWKEVSDCQDQKN